MRNGRIPAADAASIPTEQADTPVLDWQTMATLPDEKVEVLLLWAWPDAAPLIRVGRMAWRPYDGSPVFILDIDYGDASASIWTKRDDPPTHWMPLPPIPKPTAAVAESAVGTSDSE